MTSEAHPSASTDGHPEVADISALAEGLLPPEQSSAVRAHLAECDVCADIEASLDEIRGLLGNLPGPAAMPEDIATRIDAALAAEALVSRETASGPDAVSRETEDEPSAVSRETTTGLPRPRTADRPAGHASASTRPGRSHPGGKQRGRGARLALSVAASVAVIAGGVWLGSVAVDGAGGGSSDDAGVAKEGAASGKMAPSISRAELGDRVKTLLEAPDNDTLEGSGDATVKGTPKGEDHRDAPVVPTCIRDVIHRSEQPVAVNENTIRGQQIYVVVLPHPGDRAQVDAYAVSAICVTEPGTPSELLQKSTYPRP
ncbi:hypothetical protein G5C51_08230 [Streptomyces sp. A7024]|uniref:Putative zinc-finger domain-containing protein n=1 Tax=Streptomyces coryli TaxID=1128680 RepID=A0A6G4TVU2_9ACTN|nr:hypothetical protein [Streptomyces coryli]